MKKYGYILFLLTLFSLSCKETVDPPEPTIARGEVVSYELIQSFSKDQIDSVVQALFPPLFAASIEPQQGADVYQVRYGSIDEKGNPVTLSGAICFPQDTATSFPHVSYQHATITHKELVPSRGYPASYEMFIGLILAGDGMVVSAADYLGLGDSEGIHPYIHAETEATASLDMIRAARLVASELDKALDRELMVAGYSQGGHATMALTRMIEEDFAIEFALTASAPMAGPYDLSGTMKEKLLADEPYGSPHYVPYLIMGYDRVYELFDSPAEYFIEPYASQVAALFSGTKSTQDIDQSLPAIPKEMLRQEVVEALENDPSHPLSIRLAENDLYDWTPTTPMRLYHCLADELVPYANSEVTLESFQNSGATQVGLYTPDNLNGLDFGHEDCAGPSLLGTRDWFMDLVE